MSYSNLKNLNFEQDLLELNAYLKYRVQVTFDNLIFGYSIEDYKTQYGINKSDVNLKQLVAVYI